MYNEEKINKALFFSMKVHEKQKMKFPTNIPYSAHIFGVVLNIYNFVKRKEVNDWNLLIQVALLHDVLEDTHTVYEELLNNFGKNVADGVLALTKNKLLPKDEQTIDSIRRITLLSKEIAIVKLADRCFNTRCVVDVWSLSKQIKYINDSELICNNLGYASNELKLQLKHNIRKIKQILANNDKHCS